LLELIETGTLFRGRLCRALDAPDHHFAHAPAIRPAEMHHPERTHHRAALHHSRGHHAVAPAKTPFVPAARITLIAILPSLAPPAPAPAGAVLVGIAALRISAP